MTDLKIYRINFHGETFSGVEVDGSLYKVTTSKEEALNIARNYLLEQGLNPIEDVDGCEGIPFMLSVKEYALETLISHWNYVP